MIHGHCSLLMPFFKPIGKEYSKYKENIEEHLRRLRNTESHLGYESEDMLCRHIGLHRENNEIQLFDFNNMKEIAQDNVEDHIEKHLDILSQRAPKEEKEPSTPEQRRKPSTP